ncbi:MAG: MFS transporter [Clostridiales bacterium]|nr:MFS transporter [Clostridiales bacterium]
MSDNKIAEELNKTEIISAADEKPQLYKNRNYVGVKETISYLMNDWSNSFNIDGFNERFIWDVVKIDFSINAAVHLVTSAWDIINDSLISVIVDNTRTRLGKFRPYLVAMQLPMTILGIFYWLIPLFFGGTSGTYIPKLIYYYLFNVIRETAGTFTGVAKSGYMSTITPNPNERIRLITLAELLTGYMGEDMPRYIMGVLIDLVNNKVVKWKLSSVFIVMGVLTATISSICTFWFFLASKERVPQSLERPNVKEGFKAIFTNYPVLLMCLSDFLGNFAISKSDTNYFIDVLGSYSLITILNLPSSFNGSISYAFVKPLRRRFSSKALWIISDIYGDVLNLGVFLFGFRKNMFKRRLPMCIAFGLKEWFGKWMWGVTKVINADLWNEAMDYCEWKNGYRMEATTGVAKGLVLKLQGAVLGSVTDLLMKKIGYVQGLSIGSQNDHTKFWEFALCTAVPTITGALGIVPKFLWPITKEKRTIMYDELAKRRQSAIDDYVSDFENNNLNADA